MEEREQERIRMQKKAAKEKRRAEHIVVAANPKSSEIKTIKNELRTDARRKVYTQNQHKQLPNKPDSKNYYF